MNSSLPQGFLDRMKKLLGNEFDCFLSSYSKDSLLGLRVNNLKVDIENFQEKFPYKLSKIPWSDYGFYYDYKDKLGKHPYHYAGLYYMQEPSAMIVAQVLNPKEGDKVLDLCAAPGGKATYIAQLMKDTGLVVANEIVSSRAKILRENVERLGITNTVILNESPAKIKDIGRFNEFFDKILIDAPCSGEGMFRKDKEACKYWSVEHIIGCSNRQLEIIESASELLKGGGRLVYSTCTMAPEENERVISQFISRHPEFVVEDISYKGFTEGTIQWQNEAYNEQVQRAIRLYPHKTKGEGHFIASLIKSQSNNLVSNIKYDRLIYDKSILKDYYDFRDKYILKAINKRIVMFKENIYMLPDYMPSLDKLKVISAGLNVGELRKKRFVPSHHLAMSLKANEILTTYNIDSSSANINRYLRGEVIELTEANTNGWVVVTVDGHPLGWGKAVDGSIKNHYPKALRIQK